MRRNWRRFLTSILDTKPARKPAMAELNLSLLMKRRSTQRMNLYTLFINAKNRANRKLSLFEVHDVKFLISFEILVRNEMLLTSSLIANPLTKVRQKLPKTFSTQECLCLHCSVLVRSNLGIAAKASSFVFYCNTCSGFLFENSSSYTSVTLLSTSSLVSSFSVPYVVKQP